MDDVPPVVNRSIVPRAIDPTSGSADEDSDGLSWTSCARGDAWAWPEAAAAPPFLPSRGRSAGLTWAPALPSHLAASHVNTLRGLMRDLFIPPEMVSLDMPPTLGARGRWMSCYFLMTSCSHQFAQLMTGEPLYVALFIIG